MRVRDLYDAVVDRFGPMDADTPVVVELAGQYFAVRGVKVRKGWAIVTAQHPPIKNGPPA